MALLLLSQDALRAAKGATAMLSDSGEKLGYTATEDNFVKEIEKALDQEKAGLTSILPLEIRSYDDSMCLPSRPYSHGLEALDTCKHYARAEGAGASAGSGPRPLYARPALLEYRRSYPSDFPDIANGEQGVSFRKTFERLAILQMVPCDPRNLAALVDVVHLTLADVNEKREAKAKADAAAAAAAASSKLPPPLARLGVL